MSNRRRYAEQQPTNDLVLDSEWTMLSDARSRSTGQKRKWSVDPNRNAKNRAGPSKQFRPWHGEQSENAPIPRAHDRNRMSRKNSQGSSYPKFSHWQSETHEAYATLANQTRRDLRKANDYIDELRDDNRRMEQALDKKDARISMLEEEVRRCRDIEVEDGIKIRTLEKKIEASKKVEKENPYKKALGSFLTNIRAGYRLAAAKGRQEFLEMGAVDEWESFHDNQVTDEFFLGLHDTSYEVRNHVVDWAKVGKEADEDVFNGDIENGYLVRPKPIEDEGEEADRRQTPRQHDAPIVNVNGLDIDIPRPNININPQTPKVPEENDDGNMDYTDDLLRSESNMTGQDV